MEAKKNRVYCSRRACRYYVNSIESRSKYFLYNEIRMPPSHIATLNLVSKGEDENNICNVKIK
uniref:Uncharacterized protein n=1 Tax=Siphoviridae sp. ctXQq5 TaxID=2826368 RepID=A0A8S5N134_9CAUD|nr:MAG TPA: hypothetical protein [Siphoviridae sp. ctXQq5]